ncbi:exodeoxyribonuclease VII small subunit [Kordiimonas sp.]|uniref:exodeoxyribonuclease VII small subunit n=1 Tax=Kordiimonas sp. TaxID=1970157 RepID=UPI003A90375A
MADVTTDTENMETLSFEQAMSALDEVVAKLESGNASLEDSIEIYTKGTALKAHCEAKLKDAQAKIEKITLDTSGKAAGTAPLDVE